MVSEERNKTNTTTTQIDSRGHPRTAEVLSPPAVEDDDATLQLLVGKSSVRQASSSLPSSSVASKGRAHFDPSGQTKGNGQTEGNGQMEGNGPTRDR